MRERIDVTNYLLPLADRYSLVPGGYRLTASLLLAGRSGTGKTTAANILAELYDAENIKIGNEVRLETASPDKVGFIQTTSDLDRRIDRIQQELIASTLQPDTDPFILEGRLSGVWAMEERERLKERGSNKELPVVTILFIAPRRTRWKRIRDRQEEDYTLKQIAAAETDRESRNLKNWWDLYPQLKGIDPFNPGNKDTSGNPMYDLVVSTANRSVIETVVFVHESLHEVGAVVSESETFAEQDVVFQHESTL